MDHPRDRCPACDNKLHPQEMEALLGGKKLDCWHCGGTLKARVRGYLSFVTQTLVGLTPVYQSFVDRSMADWQGFVFAGLVIGLIHVLPPGLVKGAPWVHIAEHETWSEKTGS